MPIEIRAMAIELLAETGERNGGEQNTSKFNFLGAFGRTATAAITSEMPV
jgi:hypothetical protein